MTLFDNYVFEELCKHINHDLEVVAYGDDERIWNVAIECRDCCIVLHDIEPDSKNPMED